jgi:hypothetical protein
MAMANAPLDDLARAQLTALNRSWMIVLRRRLFIVAGLVPSCEFRLATAGA